MAEPNPLGDLLKLAGSLRSVFTTEPKDKPNELSAVVAWLHGINREQRAEMHVLYSLLREYRTVALVDVDPENVAAWKRIETLEKRLAALTCPCCVQGNHTEECVCDGTTCCHPENHTP